MLTRLLLRALTPMLLIPPTWAGTLTAGVDAPTLQETIGLAAAGDTVIVPTGTWAECIELDGVDLTLAGDGSDLTVLAGDCETTVTVRGGTVALSGMTVRTGSANGVVAEGAISVWDDVAVIGDPTVALEGNGVYVDGGELTATGGRIVDHTGGRFGANLHLTGAAVARLEGMEIAGGTCLPLYDDYTERDFSLAGGIWADTGVQLALVGVTLSGNSAWSGGAVYADEDSLVTSEGSTWEDNQACCGRDHGNGGGIYAVGTFHTTGDRFAGNAADVYGGAVYSSMSGSMPEITVTLAEFSSNYAGRSGGAIASESFTGDTLVLTDSTFAGNAAGSYGGAVYLDSYYQNFESARNRYDANSAPAGGAIFSSTFSVITSRGDSFTSNVAWDPPAPFFYSGGGALRLAGCASGSVVEDGVFTDNVSADGGGAVQDWSCDLAVARAEFWGNQAVYGGALALDDASVSLVNSVFVENRGEERGGACAVEDGALSLVNDTLVGNTAPAGDAVWLERASATVWNTLVAWHPGTALEGSGATAIVTYSDWWSNGADAGGGLTVTVGADGNLAEEPSLRAWAADGVWDDKLWPVSGSALIDAGDPAILDADGSVSDIGAYGGPGAATVDEDADGYDLRADCDDTAPAVYPSAPEVPGDGVDQDCDGTDAPLPEDTGDTAPPDTAGTDTDATDTVETDTDPADTGASPPDAGCGCGVAGAPGGALLALPLLAARRRPRTLPEAR